MTTDSEPPEGASAEGAPGALPPAPAPGPTAEPRSRAEWKAEQAQARARTRANTGAAAAAGIVDRPRGGPGGPHGRAWRFGGAAVATALVAAATFALMALFIDGTGDEDGAVGGDDTGAVDGGSSAPSSAATTPSVVPSGEAGASTAPTSTTTTPPPTTTTLAPLRLEAITVGFVNQHESAVGSFPEVSEAFAAAADYVNDELDGIRGVPVELQFCLTDGTPDSSRRCGELMVNVGARVVLLGVDFGSPALYPVLAEAGIPVVGGIPRLLQDYGAEEARFFVGGSITQLPALAAYAQSELAAETVAVVTADALASDTLARILVIDPLERVGVLVISVAPADARADLAPGGRAADADAVIVLAEPDSCAALAAAARSKPVLMSGACEGVDASSGGRRFYASETVAITGTEAGDAFAEAMRGREPGGLAAVAFSALVDVAELLSRSYDTRGRPLDVLEVLDEQAERASFLGGPYRCDRRLALAPSVCGSAVAIVEIGVDTQPVWIDGTALLVDDD